MKKLIIGLVALVLVGAAIGGGIFAYHKVKNYYGGSLYNPTSKTVTNLTTANFSSPNVSQWTNDIGYVTTTGSAVNTTTVRGMFSGNSPIVFSTSTGVISWTNSIGYITTTPAETDPVWLAASSSYLTVSDASSTYLKISDSSSLAYVKTEVDPVWSAVSTSLTVSNFATNTISQWVNDAGYVTTTGSSGTVNSGNTGQVAYYTATGTAVSGTSSVSFDSDAVRVLGQAVFGSTSTISETMGMKNGNVMFASNGALASILLGTPGIAADILAIDHTINITAAASTSTATADLQLGTMGFGSHGGSVKVGAGAADSYFNVTVGGRSTNALRIQPDESASFNGSLVVSTTLGIGTTTPSVSLDVVGRIKANLGSGDGNYVCYNSSTREIVQDTSPCSLLGATDMLGATVPIKKDYTGLWGLLGLLGLIPLFKKK